ncbi:MAG TPA: hypothetical protein VFN46_09690, partial [Acetobacteraceae bacterium]|nr:hypothetical protein [Acetobacteraceae bacterium]
IERASFLMDDRTSGFALVLTGMLVSSGLGSMASARFGARPALAAAVAAGMVAAWCAIMFACLQPLLLACVGLSFALRVAVVLAMTAPVSFALGMPFPLGLALTGAGPFLPWAWAVNGAFSVVATPLANLIARQEGFSRVLLVALLLYVIAAVAVPAPRKPRSWPESPAP